MRDHTQVIVIGGGVAGASCTYHLARSGVRVVLIERTALGAASSGRSAAFIETQYTEPDRVRMCVYGSNLYNELASLYPLDFRTRGKLLLGRGSHDQASFQASVQLQRELGVHDSSVLDHDELVRRFPTLRINDDEFALYGASDGYLDPVALCHAYATAATKAGASVRPSTEVHAISPLSSGFELRTDRETLAADAIVIAGGAWASNLAAMLALPLPVHGYRRQVALLDAPAVSTTPLLVDPHSGDGCLYFRDDGPGRLIAGFHTELRDDTPVADPDQYDRAADPPLASRIAELVRQRFTDPASNVQAAGGWAGLYPIAADGRFVLGESHQHPGAFICAGLAGNGIQLSGAAGAIIAQLIHHQAQTILPDLSPYTPDRFS